MKRFEIRHTTRYTFDSPVLLGAHVLFLRPREGHDLRIATSTIDIAPAATLTWQRDLYDNVLGSATFADQRVTELVIASGVEVELYELMPLDFIVAAHALHFPFRYRREEAIALSPFLEPVHDNDACISMWLARYRQVPPSTETFWVIDDVNRRIHAEIAYEVRHEEGVLAPAETLRRGRGSCRDMATLMLDACRRLGIATRFVSGYVHGPATEDGGASSHAWVEVYLPGAGWKGFDPTNVAIVGPDHIPVAVHRHPEAIPPVAGTFTGPQGLLPTLTVDVRINAPGGTPPDS